MTIARKGAATAVATIAALSLAACGGGSSDSGSGGGGDKINVGIKFDQPGLGLKEGAKYTGFDVDVATYVAKEMGKTPNFVESVSSQRETLIKTGKVDYIVATYSMNDKRKAVIDFAGPYFVAGQDVLVKSDSTIASPEQMKGKKMCSVKGSTSATTFAEKFPGVQLQQYDTYSKCAEAVSTGAIDAMTTDDTILAGYASQSQYKGKLKVLGKPFSEENYGIGMKQGNKELCTKITAAVTKMISSGEWQKAVEKNLGPAGYKTPTAPTVPSTCE
ncbi:MAG: glutamate ABC transporter substrate-binding protein [Micrococcales bacterium]|nr:glutamate ABC transporter substrate-binding protein [Micrococcales bacterium]